jgi:hypothetical protein
MSCIKRRTPSNPAPAAAALLKRLDHEATEDWALFKALEALDIELTVS